MNWQKEFELFMAQQPDHEGVPVWDRFLWAFHKNSGADLDMHFTVFSSYGFILSAFFWGDTNEGHEFWSDLDRKWLDHVDKL